MKKIALLLACLMLGMTLLASCGSTSSGAAVYAPGATSESGFSSDWLGLTFTPTSGMAMLSQDEIFAMMDLGADAMGMDQSKVEWAKMVTVYEMMATEVVTGSNVIVMTEKLSVKSITVEQYVDALKTQYNNQLGESAMAYDELGEATVAGEKYTRFVYEMTVNGVTVGQTMLLRKIDDRMVAICITATTADAEQAFINCFSAK